MAERKNSHADRKWAVKIGIETCIGRQYKGKLHTYTAAFFEEEVIKNLRSVLFTFFLLSDKIEPKELAIDFISLNFLEKKRV